MHLHRNGNRDNHKPSTTVIISYNQVNGFSPDGMEMPAFHSREWSREMGLGHRLREQ
jgi:hypothetical protein